MNDAYLKANGQENGLRSYGRMVDLLLAYYRDKPAIDIVFLGGVLYV